MNDDEIEALKSLYTSPLQGIGGSPSEASKEPQRVILVLAEVPLEDDLENRGSLILALSRSLGLSLFQAASTVAGKLPVALGSGSIEDFREAVEKLEGIPGVEVLLLPEP